MTDNEVRVLFGGQFYDIWIRYRSYVCESHPIILSLDLREEAGLTGPEKSIKGSSTRTIPHSHFHSVTSSSTHQE